jgi:2'-hydroxyisoflavone reductase
MNRRDALKLVGSALGTVVVESAVAQSTAPAGSKPLRVLILGGTGFIGPHIVNALREGGHQLTLFNRGKRNPGLFKDVETVLGDRDGKVDALKGRDWDAVIDNSGYVPRQVKLTADLLKGHTQQYIFVSSISAYGDLAKIGIDEDHPVAKLKDASVEQVTNETYGGLKALCEQVVMTAYGKQGTIFRPSYIVGPGDTSDRFTYWPVRVSRGGVMLAPGTPKDPIQFIDVRDLADFGRVCVEHRVGGTYNLCNQPRAVSMGQLLETSKSISKSNASYQWANEAFIEKHKLLESGEIPIWSPTTGSEAGGALISCERAVKKGLKFRPLQTTVADTLAWHAKRPAAEQQRLRAGLTAEREAELLKLI